jgi:hypothetical protein
MVVDLRTEPTWRAGAARSAQAALDVDAERFLSFLIARLAAP